MAGNSENSVGESDVSITDIHASSIDCDDTLLVLQRSASALHRIYNNILTSQDQSLWLTYVSVNSNWVHPPWATPGHWLKKLALGVRICLLKFARGQEFDKDWDFVENENETSKK